MAFDGPLPPRFSFEVKETDLMGRLGVVKLGGKRFETPCLTPVIHPVWRDIPLPQFKAMGFEILMTNSYILYKRQRAEALEKGLHELIGFDGVLMTDSGGYQVLEYGDTEFTPHQIAEFQSSIGSDLAVTLDNPTGKSNSRAYARQTMEESLRAAKATIEDFGESETVWVGPIQGGTFSDLVRSSTRGLVSAGFQVLALGSPVELLEGYMFSPLVEMIINAKKAMPYSMPLHLFGAGHPLTLPLSVALGCDTFDSASYMLYAKKDRYMTERGTLQLERMTYLPCSCPICNNTSVGDLRVSQREERVRKIALHNLHVLRADVLRCKEAICEGRLWDLVEERAMAHPRAAAAFRALVRWHSDLLVKPTRLLKRRGLLVRSDEDGARPELALARSHLDRLIARSGRRGSPRTAVIVPSRVSPPLTGGVRAKRKTLPDRLRVDGKIDVYRTNSQLGPYPAELEFVFPFAQTIADREAPGASLEKGVRRLKEAGYAKVVVVASQGWRARTSTKTRRRRKKKKEKKGSGKEGLTKRREKGKRGRLGVDGA